MEKGNTKEKILEAALDLFSVKGFEATSISQLADTVGIRKASLYSHFSSKQEILDTLIGKYTIEFNQYSIFVNADWDNPEFTKDKSEITPEMLTSIIKGQIQYIIHDSKISKIRKMLTIEQFQNADLAKLQTRQNYEDVLRYFTGLVGFLIRQGVLTEDDPEIMAAQLCLPITVWLGLCDREPEREQEVMGLVERHIRQFFRIYGTLSPKPDGRDNE